MFCKTIRWVIVKYQKYQCQFANLDLVIFCVVNKSTEKIEIRNDLIVSETRA